LVEIATQLIRRPQDYTISLNLAWIPSDNHRSTFADTPLTERTGNISDRALC